VRPKVLLLGANGLLGRSLTRHLLAAGYDTLGHARAGQADVVADLTDAAALGSALDATRPDVIVNLVALTNVDECERAPQRAYLANVRSVENLVRWMDRRADSCHLIQISTDQVYDGAGPHAEADVTLSNYYGFSKYAGELVAAAAPSTVLRTNFFGRSECRGRATFTDWLVASMREAVPITVFEDVYFSPLSMQRLAQVVGQLIECRPRGVFNAGSREGISKADFAFMLADELGLSTDHVRRGTAEQSHLLAYRPKDMRMDCSRIEAALGIALPTLMEEIQSMHSIYANQAD
jgi:dTDP-4-dehydrorhamnose reductase